MTQRGILPYEDNLEREQETLALFQLEIAGGYGGLVVVAFKVYTGYETACFTLGANGLPRLDESGKYFAQVYYGNITEYKRGDQVVYAAVFPSLPPDTYGVFHPGIMPRTMTASVGQTTTLMRLVKRVTVFPGRIAQVTFKEGDLSVKW